MIREISHKVIVDAEAMAIYGVDTDGDREWEANRLLIILKNLNIKRHIQGCRSRVG